MSRNLLRLCSLVLLVAFPASMMASDVVGVLNSSGEVSLRGEPTISGTAVFSGDTIRTGRSGRAAIVEGPGTSIAIAPGSIVQVEEGAVEIGSGLIVVSGHRASLQVNGVHIVSQNDMGKFLVQRDGDSLKVVALAGNLLVGEGQDQTPVPATKGVNVGNGKNKNQTNAPAAKGPPRWLTDPDIGILIVVGAAVAAGVALGIVNAENARSATPVAP